MTQAVRIDAERRGAAGPAESAQAWRARYGGAADAPPAALAAGEGVIAGLLAHRSVRAYRPDPLPEGALELILGAAQSAASSSNLQLWSAIAVREPARRAALAEAAAGQRHVRECPLFVAWIADLHRLARIAELRGLASEGLRYLEMFVMASVDAALAAQNAVVAAESLGLGTVFIGALRNQPERVAELLELPQGAFALFGLCIGYPSLAEPAAVKPRLAQDAVGHRETYRPFAAQREHVAEYDALMRDFYGEQRMPVKGDWSEHCTERVRSPAALRGRAQLRASLERLGFGLR